MPAVSIDSAEGGEGIAEQPPLSCTWLLAWAEMLVVCWYVEHGATQEAIALAQGRSGSADLVHHFRRHAGVTPGTLVKQGGFATLVSQLKVMTSRK